MIRTECSTATADLTLPSLAFIPKEQKNWEAFGMSPLFDPGGEFVSVTGSSQGIG